jgi:hypothetical protein
MRTLVAERWLARTCCRRCDRRGFAGAPVHRSPDGPGRPNRRTADGAGASAYLESEFEAAWLITDEGELLASQAEAWWAAKT